MIADNCKHPHSELLAAGIAAATAVANLRHGNPGRIEKQVRSIVTKFFFSEIRMEIEDREI